MNKDQRAAVIASATEIVNNSNSTFKYKPPNNSGAMIAIIGGILSTAGDALSTIGGIIQLNSDVASDYQSQVEDFQSDQEKNKMQEEIDNLNKKVKQLEALIMKNQNQERIESYTTKRDQNI